MNRYPESMAFVRLASLYAVPAGSAIQVELDGKAFALCNVDGEIYCVDGLCPHAGGPLGEGTLHGSILVCPWHSWEFDCRTGQVDGADDDEDAVQTYKTSVEGDDILIDIA